MSQEQLQKNKPCVYFISDGNGNCKIGIASNIVSRLNNMQVGNAKKLSVLHIEYFDSISDAKDREKLLHSKLSQFRVSGEWYQEEIVKIYLSGAEIPKKKWKYEEFSDFNLCDLIELYISLLSSRDENDFSEKSKNIKPYIWEILR